MERASGILLPIFSLPGKYGIGTFGKEAYKFIDYISDAGVKYWQVLPMHPITYGNSPYQSTSTYGGNMYLIDLDMLESDGLLKKSEYQKLNFGDDKNKVDYDKVIAVKKPLLMLAAKRFVEKHIDDTLYVSFKKDFEYFLDEFVTFDLIKDKYAGESFSKWDRIHRLHYDEVIKEFKKQNEAELELYRAIQYFFYKQWFNLKKYANDEGIKIIGDMPIYSSLDSVEVFSDYKNFKLDSDRRPYEVAGCPPDAFSAEGQHWGNPIYDYEYMKSDGYKYFVKRISHLAKLYDVLRIDHFRGFANYYSIPASEKTAINGHWNMGPGREIFDIVKKEVPNIEIIAEDLGYIDEPVYKLLSETGYPGMKVVEFAFGGDAENHQYLPKNYNEKCVAYLGTHDNDTFMSWFKNASDVEKEQATKLLHLNKGTENKDAITELYKSKANLTIILMQDLLGLSGDTRINTPSTMGPENWSYRFDDDYLKANEKRFLKEIIKETNR